MQESPTPEAMGRLLSEVRDRLEVVRIDKVWIFPPLIRGRKEWGLVAVSLAGDDTTQRSLFLARYTAELQGHGVAFESEMKPEGRVPADRLPRVMDGVVRRSKIRLGDPREVRIEGDQEVFSALLQEFGAEERRPREKEDARG